MLFGLLALLFSFSDTQAHHGYLDSPVGGGYVSGLGFISGWRCDAGTLTVSLNDGPQHRMASGQPRADTREACGDDDNGFILQINWNLLGDGRHKIVLYDDGVEFLRSSFTVVTPGVEFIWRDQGGCIVPDFPAPGETGHFAWSQATQHLELVDVTPNVPTEPDTEEPEEEKEEEEEEQPSLEERCQNDDGSIDMCCFCCDPEGQNQPICTQNPQIAEQCRFRPEGCGPPNPVHGSCGTALNTCDAGTYYDSPDSDTLYRWECRGRHDGSTAYCYELISPDPGAEFHGRWSLSSVITAHCSLVEGEGEMRVNAGGRISGWFQQKETVRTGDGTYRRNLRFPLRGTVSETGTVEARLEWSDGVTVDGWFTGSLSNGRGSGTWHDTAGCVGTWRARKQD